MNKKYNLMIILFVALFSASNLFAASDNDSKKALIDQILMVEKKQLDAIQTLTLDAELIEGEWDEGEFVEETKIIKKVYLKYQADKNLIYEDYLELYLEGEKQSDKKLTKEAKERKEKKERRNTPDISSSMLKPFYPEYASLYNITYVGVSEEQINDRVVHHFKVNANEEIDSLINGDFYFDSESYYPVRIDFTPAKLTKKAMFKMKELKMSLNYTKADNGYCFPSKFEIEGKGKAMFFIGIRFAGTEYYRNPQINLNIDDKFQEE